MCALSAARGFTGIAMNIVTKRICVVFALCLLLPLAACREEEQGRPLTYEKGVYGGPEDEALTEEDREELRMRARDQNF